jgi:hypothetical protein
MRPGSEPDLDFGITSIGRFLLVEGFLAAVNLAIV